PRGAGARAGAGGTNGPERGRGFVGKAALSSRTAGPAGPAQPSRRALMRIASARSPLAIALALALPLGLAACDRTPTSTTPAGDAAPAVAEVTAEEREAETARLNAWFEEQYEAQLQFSPIRMTFL